MIYSMVMSWPRLACASSDTYFLRSGFSRRALSIAFFFLLLLFFFISFLFFLFLESLFPLANIFDFLPVFGAYRHFGPTNDRR